jgi:D-alanyl-D-alanine carboxypeptidase/D-alanyl-D-alanine-endopeptidase (penicillin-binding protein 4)
MQHIKSLSRLATTAAALFLFAHTLLAVEPLNTDALRQTLDTLIDQHPTADRTTVTLKVVDLATGKVLYNRGGNKLLTPASNLKIYTSSAALDLLGPDYTWTTEVLSTAKIKSGTCNGNLILRSTGDPMLNTEELAKLADTLVNDHKLRVVRGTVTVQSNPRWNQVPLKGPGWMWDDDPDYYNMSIQSMMLDFNTLTVTATPSKGAVAVDVTPASAWPTVEVDAQIGGDKPNIKIDRDPFYETIHVTGKLPANATPVQDTITMHDPSRWIAAVFQQMLIDRGVEFRDESMASSSTDTFPLVSQQGQTLTQAIRHFLKVSENAVGEMVLLKLAETQTQEDVTWPTGANVITDWLINTAGLEPGSFRLDDGSGLSRYNLISADSSIKLLTFMKKHKHFDPFFDGLPTYKVSLPDDDTWNNTPLKTFEAERVFAKTGGMSGVSTISGYIQTLDNQWLAFSFLGNGYTGSSKPVKDLRNKVWQELIRFQADEMPAN